MIAESEVESRDVHASFDHLGHLIHVRARRSQCCNDGCLALVEIDLLEDVLEPDAARVLTDRLAPCFNHN